MARPDTIKRGELVFERKVLSPNTEVIRCTLGDPESAESEHMFEFHASFVKDVIAGLTAMTKTP